MKLILDLFVKLLTSEFFLGIISGALLSVFGHRVAQKWWLKNQVWLSKRDLYVEILEKSARFFDLSRQIRSSYLALDSQSALDKIKERDSLVLDLSQLAVRAALILQNDEVLHAVMDVVAAQVNVAKEVNENLESIPQPRPMNDVCQVMAWGLEQQADAAAASIKTIHRAALSDLGLRKDLFSLPEKWKLQDDEVIQLRLSESTRASKDA